MVSCSNDETAPVQAQESNAGAFLTTFYKDDVRRGESAQAGVNVSSLFSKAEAGTFYTLTEVFVGNEPRARGYDYRKCHKRIAVFC